MANPQRKSIFQLQQFSLNQSLSGMKVCSDSLIFGALIPVDRAKNILDIGAGTGILSLMQAQKTAATLSHLPPRITAVELTQEAATEASENFAKSPWAKRLILVEQDIQDFSQRHSEEQFDVIICNPPFFAAHSKTDKKNPLRHVARHTDQLSFEVLWSSVDLLLTSSGSSYFLLPIIAHANFIAVASRHNMVLVEQIDLAESDAHAVKVSVLKFIRQHNAVAPSVPEKIVYCDGKQHTRLNKFVRKNEHSDAVKALLSPFLLRYR